MSMILSKGLFASSTIPPRAIRTGAGRHLIHHVQKLRYKIYNIGNSSPVELMDFIEAIEKTLGKKAKKNMLPIQPGDVPQTYADVDALIEDVGFKPSTPIEKGIQSFVNCIGNFICNQV